MRISKFLFIATLCGLAHCSKRSNTLEVSPPLPPAEEPSDDVEGAVAPDAGAAQN